MPGAQSWWSGPQASESDGSRRPPNLRINPMEVDEVAAEANESEQLLTRRVHVLGLGSIGTFVAHSLRCLPNPPPISLLLHRPSMYEAFKQGGRIVRLVNKKTDVNDEQRGYDVDVAESEGQATYWRHVPDTPSGKSREPSSYLSPEEEMETGEVFIYNLIVTVKGPHILGAMKSIRHRVDSRTTILFIQNGMGQVDALREQVFTDPATRPTFMVGVISHGAHMQGDFSVVHAGFGTLAVGISRDPDKHPLPPRDGTTNIADFTPDERRSMFPTDKELFSNLSSRYLLRTVTRSPILACAAFPHLDLLQLQLEKLAMNCVLNPLTALLDVPNGSMLRNTPLTQAQRLLTAEISMVIRGLPELEGVPNINQRFSASRLEPLFKKLSSSTAENSSSMREDVRRGKMTEIDFINGYIVKRGEQQGIKCVLNYLIMQLVHSKTFPSRGQKDSNVPYGVSMIEGQVNPDSLGQGPSGVTLDDTGTPLR